MINDTISRIPILIIKPYTKGRIESCIMGLDCPTMETIIESGTNYNQYIIISIIIILGFLMYVNFKGDDKCIIK